MNDVIVTKEFTASKVQAFSDNIVKILTTSALQNGNIRKMSNSKRKNRSLPKKNHGTMRTVSVSVKRFTRRKSILMIAKRQTQFIMMLVANIKER